MSLLNSLKKLLDPEGPIGSVASPSIVYKERQGLPIGDARAYTARATHNIDVHEIAKALAPVRFVSVDEGSAPASRLRQVSLHVEEEWKPVYAPSTGDSYAAVFANPPRLLGWQVTQKARSQYCDCGVARFSKTDGEMLCHKCQRPRPKLSDAEVVERAMHAQMQPGDTHYQQYAVTIPGTDKALYRGREVTGGTRIRSRKHYNQLTKNMVLWDRGVPREIERAKAEQDAKRKATIAKDIERTVHRMVSDRPGDL